MASGPLESVGLKAVFSLGRSGFGERGFTGAHRVDRVDRVDLAGGVVGVAMAWDRDFGLVTAIW